MNLLHYIDIKSTKKSRIIAFTDNKNTKRINKKKNVNSNEIIKKLANIHQSKCSFNPEITVPPQKERKSITHKL